VSWPAATRKDHETFCLTEGWQQVRDARGRTGTHHVTYELHLHDGRILRTRISHPVNRDGYGPAMWALILRDQLAVGEGAFWACVRDGVKPGRGEPEARRDALPADLAYLLITRLHLAESEVAAMTRDEAVARIAAYWSTGTPD
jgi:hypothetical protein